MCLAQLVHRRGEARHPQQHLPLPGNDAQPHHQQRERLTGHPDKSGQVVPRVQGGELQDQEGAEDASEGGGRGGGESVEGLGVPVRKASPSRFPLQVLAGLPAVGFPLQSLTR